MKTAYETSAAAAAAAAAAAKSLQSCLTLCDPIDGKSKKSDPKGHILHNFLYMKDSE